jgi:hypothetical protein
MLRVDFVSSNTLVRELEYEGMLLFSSLSFVCLFGSLAFLLTFVKKTEHRKRDCYECILRTKQDAVSVYDSAIYTHRPTKYRPS